LHKQDITLPHGKSIPLAKQKEENAILYLRKSDTRDGCYTAIYRCNKIISFYRQPRRTAHFQEASVGKGGCFIVAALRLIF